MMAEYGAFCNLYGKTLRNSVLEYMLEMDNLDFAVGDVAAELSISRPKMYQIIKHLEKENIDKKTRTVAGTQLYSLNTSSKPVKLLKKSFKECLKLIIGSHSEKIPIKSSEVIKAHA